MLSQRGWNIVGAIVVALAFAGLLALGILTGDRNNKPATNESSIVIEDTQSSGASLMPEVEQTEDGNIMSNDKKASDDADLNIGTTTQQETAAGVETPTNYEFLFDDCPRGAAKTFKKVSDTFTIKQCASACTADMKCLAFETNGCDANKTCGKQCYLFYGNYNISLPNTITRGNCKTNHPVVGYKKAYRKKS